MPTRSPARTSTGVGRTTLVWMAVRGKGPLSANAGHDGKDEIELLLGARDGDVEEAPLLFFARDDDLALLLVLQHQRELLRHFAFRNAHDAARHAQRALRRKPPVRQPDDEDD